MTQSPKLTILQKLDAMDSMQLQGVLVYIRSVLAQTEQSNINKKLAMKEIREALRHGKKDLQLEP
ncbi:MAG: hypothetical protein ACKO96_03805 [Flammeovirgaceae bacterium]